MALRWARSISDGVVLKAVYKWKRKTMRYLSLHWFAPVFQGVFLSLIAMTLHEVGHIAAALALGIRVKRVGLSSKGIYIVRDSGPPSKSMLVALAGPSTNLALLVAWHWWPTFGLVNLIIGAVNLLPIECSDGSRILRSWNEVKCKWPFGQPSMARVVLKSSSDARRDAAREPSRSASVSCNRFHTSHPVL